MTRLALLLIVVVTSAAVTACGNGEGEKPAATGNSAYSATISAEDKFSIGPSRFVFSLVDARGRPATNARVHLRFFFIDPVRNDRKTVKSELDANPVQLDQTYDMVAEDGTALTLGPGSTGVFANNVAFDQAGEWVVDLSGRDGNNDLGVIELPFSVAEDSLWPQEGRPAPPTDGEPPSQPEMIIFGTEGVCRSPVCGPLVDVANDIADEYSGRLITTNVAPGGDSQRTSYPDWVESWAVDDEPVVFFIDADRILRGRLHTIASREEIESLVRSLLP